MKARAPGKLILSGEHAVVHGRPALVMAVKQYAEAEISPTNDGHIHVSFPGVLADEKFPVAALHGLKQRLLRNHNAFLSGKLPIQQVLTSPAEPIYFALIELLDHGGVETESGWRVSLKTELPVGSGMGSSAAIIAAVQGVAAAAWDMELSREQLYRLVLNVEKLQHGYPSGVDPFICVHGGCARFQQGEARPLPPPRSPVHLVYTGRPASTTGECIAAVSQRFPTNDPIWLMFEQVTTSLEKAGKENNVDDIRAGIRANHRLLTRIGVVPERVAQFIARIEEDGYAAKICGAGAIRGKNGGVVAVFSRTPPKKRCEEFGYETTLVETDLDGLTISP